MYAIIWTYQARSECVDAFLEAYGADGLWVQLFKRGQGYAGTQLLRHDAADCCFMTVDRWDDEASFRRFMDEHSEQYQELDRRCSGLTEREERVDALVDAGELGKLIAQWLTEPAENVQAV